MLLASNRVMLLFAKFVAKMAGSIFAVLMTLIKDIPLTSKKSVIWGHSEPNVKGKEVEVKSRRTLSSGSCCGHELNRFGYHQERGELVGIVLHEDEPPNRV